MHRILSRSIPALAVALCPLPALADLDPGKVAALLRAGLASEGATFDATIRDEPDGAITWTDVTVRHEDLTLTTAGLRFSALPDGEVQVRWTGPFDFEQSGAKLFSFNGGGELTVSDEVPGMVKSFHFPDLTGESRAAQPDAEMSVAGAIHIRDLSGTVAASEDGKGFRLDALGSGFDFDQVVKLNATGQSTHGSGSAETLALRVDGARLDLLGLDDWRKALDQGAALTVSLSQGPSTTRSESAQPGIPPMKSLVTAASGTVNIDISRDGMSLTSEIGKMATRIEGGVLPLPVIFDGDGLAMAGAFPVSFPGKMGLGIKMPRLALGEETWSMLDPAGQLSHDPATFHLDLTGQVSMIPPASPEETEIPRIDDLDFDFGLSLLGAAISAKGNARDVDSPVTVTGGADVALTGLDQLAGALIQAGLVPQEMIEPYLQLIDQFSHPGDGDDDRRVSLGFGKGILTVDGMQMPMPGAVPEEDAN